MEEKIGMIMLVERFFFFFFLIMSSPSFSSFSSTLAQVCSANLAWYVSPVATWKTRVYVVVCCFWEELSSTVSAAAARPFLTSATASTTALRPCGCVGVWGRKEWRGGTAFL